MQNILLYILLGIIAGIASGLFGIGGGLIMIPALVFIFGMNQHTAQGTSLAVMIPPVGILAAYKYYQAGNLKISIAIWIALGFVVGGLIGASLIQPIQDITLKRLFGVFLAFLSIKLILGK